MVQAGSLKVRGIGFLCCVALLTSCFSEDKNKTPDTKKTKVERRKVQRPPFSADSAYQYIKRQVEFGPRVPNSKAHVAAGNYLVDKLNEFGFEVTEQKTKVTAYDNTKLNIRNIIGTYKPALNNRILLYSHWDSRHIADQDEDRRDEPIDGANDGASGVGILLEIARQLQQLQPNIGVDIIFFDAEDYGESSGDINSWCLGSQYWAKNPHKVGYSANFGILLDMVGAKNAVFTKEFHSMRYAAAYVNYVWNIASDLGYGSRFVPVKTQFVGVDDHVYVNELAKIPSIDIIQYDPSTGAFAPYWHTHDDNIDSIDKTTLQVVGETVLATVVEESKLNSN